MGRLWRILLVSGCIIIPGSCLPVDTQFGDDPGPPFPGEDWCTAGVESRWPVSYTIDMTINPVCSEFGGQLRFEPDSPFDGDADGEVGPTPIAYDFTGLDVSWRWKPNEGSDPFFGYVEFIEAAANPFIRFELLPDGNIAFTLYSDFGATDEYLEITYDPDVHQWMRLTHDASTGVMTLWTGSYCGNWTARVSGVVSSGVERMAVELFHRLSGFGGTGNTGEPGWIGEMYTCAYEPEES
jgi:hypothetical protein